MDARLSDWTPEPLSPRKRASKAVRRFFLQVGWKRELKRLKPWRNAFAGRRVFLVGSGPSLKGMELAGLAGEMVCVVNLGLRAVGSILPHADIHVVFDVTCIKNFGDEIERLVIEKGVDMRFFNARRRREWFRMPVRGARPMFVFGQKFPLRVIGHVEPLETGCVRGGTVLIGACHILDFLGFKEIYLLGCDLDYSSPNPYAYAMQEKDWAHERSDDVQSRRRDLVHMNGEFSIMRTYLEALGKRLVNAGVGGKLTALERRSLDEVLGSRQDQSPDLGSYH